MASGKVLAVDSECTSDMWDWPLQHNDGIVKVLNTPEKFEVGLEVHYFTPKEIEVKVCGEELLVHCRHLERTDTFGRVPREIHRAYKLPSDINLATLNSHLTQKGLHTN